MALVDYATSAGVALLTLNDPPVNGYTHEMMKDLDAAILEARFDNDVHVIVITGHGDVPLAVKAMKAGATDFIEKPFSDDIILASIEAAARSRYVKKTGAAVDAIGKRIARLTPREVEMFQQLKLQCPCGVVTLQPAFPRLIECVHHFAVHVDLQLGMGGVADADGPRSLVAG